MGKTKELNDFTRLLMKWHREENIRDLPWKGEPDPYKIWLSEIIMQQTRVGQGQAYYERFVNRFPDIFSLAAAQDDDVFKYWEGLGYYNRCRNLLVTARQLVNENNGRFPADYNALLALKGIGPYTAAALASFGFGLPYAVVDGNVLRVLSRFFNFDTPIDEPEGKNKLVSLAQLLLDKTQPAAFNQAIMDFGATVCKPGSPLCSQCPLADACEGFAAGNEKRLPVKAKRLERRRRFFAYILLEVKGSYWVSGQQKSDIWRFLNQLYRIELPDEKALIDFIPDSYPELSKWKYIALEKHMEIYQQTLTHQEISMVFFRLVLETKPKIKGGKWVEKTSLQKLAFPKTINLYLGEIGLLINI
jgi:A/G-specific adenine glycosylase